MKPPRDDIRPDYLELIRQENEERARAVAFELRAKGQTYTEIAEQLGRLYYPAEIGRWCREEAADKPDKIEALPNSTIMALFGSKGSGKSLGAAAIALENYLEGVPVYYNPRGLLKFPPMEGGICEFASLRDIILRAEHLRFCVIVLDELQVNLSKFRTSTRASVLIRGVIQQVRKLGMDIVVTSNSPSQIDSAFAEQLDFHATCSGHLPPEDPLNCINLMWTDTQGKYGRANARMFQGRAMDTRLRHGQILENASAMFKYYDHSVQVDPLEVMGLTAEQISLAKEEQDLGLTVAELRTFLRDTVIPNLVVNSGAETLVPTAAVETIANIYDRGYDHMECCRGISGQEVSEHGCKQGTRLPMIISPVLLGRTLADLGLSRRGRANAYILPPPEDLDRFRAGIWSAKE